MHKRDLYCVSPITAPSEDTCVGKYAAEGSGRVMTSGAAAFGIGIDAANAKSDTIEMSFDELGRGSFALIGRLKRPKRVQNPLAGVGGVGHREN